MAATDVHVHFIPPSLAGNGSDWRPELVVHEHAVTEVVLHGRRIDSAVDEFSRLDAIVESAKARGIDRLVLSPWVSLIPSKGSPADLEQVCRIHNEAMASAIVGFEDSVSAMAMVPVTPGASAIKILDEALSMGLVGVEVMATYGETFLGDDSMSEFFDYVADRHTPVFVHPSTRGLNLSVFADSYMWNSVGNPVETATAATNLVLSGTLERNPELAVVLAHGGGALLSILDRVERSFDVRPEARAVLKRRPSESFSKLYVDTVTHSPVLLAALIARFSASNVLLGSDWPFDMGLDDPVTMLLDTGTSAVEAEAILSGNAKRLWGLR